MRNLRSRCSRLSRSGFAIMAIFSFQSCCFAQSAGLEDVANDLADQVAAALKEVPGGTKNGLEIKTINGRETGGPGFRQAFLSALKSKGITLSKSTNYEIDGTVRFGGEPSSQSASALVKLSLRGPKFERQLTGQVNAESDVIALVGMTGALPVKLDRPLIGLSAPVPGAGQAVAANEPERQAKLAHLILHPEPPKVTPNPTPLD